MRLPCDGLSPFSSYLSSVFIVEFIMAWQRECVLEEFLLLLFSVFLMYQSAIGSSGIYYLRYQIGSIGKKSVARYSLYNGSFDSVVLILVI